MEENLWVALAVAVVTAVLGWYTKTFVDNHRTKKKELKLPKQ